MMKGTDPDPWVRDTDSGFPIQIRTKMLWIPNTGWNYVSAHSPVWLLFHCSRSQCIAGYALSQVIHRNQSEIIIWKFWIISKWESQFESRYGLVVVDMLFYAAVCFLCAYFVFLFILTHSWCHRIIINGVSLSDWSHLSLDYLSTGGNFATDIHCLVWIWIVFQH